MSNSITKRNLLYIILQNVKKDHKLEILHESTVKDAHIYCKINNLSGQVSGSLLEEYIRNKYNMTKIKSSQCRGDLLYNGINIEVKSSLGGITNNKFNYVQLRLDHIIDYYLFTAYYLDYTNVDNDGELYLFLVDKSNVINLVLDHGSYAHGTKNILGDISINNIGGDKEYALRPEYGSKLWKRLLAFRVSETDISCLK